MSHLVQPLLAPVVALSLLPVCMDISGCCVTHQREAGVPSTARRDGPRITAAKLQVATSLTPLVARVLRLSPTGFEWEARFSRDGRICAVLHQGGVCVVDVRAARVLLSLADAAPFTCAVSPNGGLLAVTGSAETISVWDLRTARPLATLRVRCRRGTAPSSLSWGEGGHRLLCLCRPRGGLPIAPVPPGEVYLLDWRTLQQSQSIAGRVLLAMSITSQGNLIFSSGVERRDPLVRVWSAESGEEVLNFRGFLPVIAPAGDMLAILRESPARDGVVDSGTITIHELPGGREVLTFPVPAPVRVLAISPDSRLVAWYGPVGSYGEDWVVHLFDTTRQKELVSVPLSYGIILGGCFDSDGKRLHVAAGHSIVTLEVSALCARQH